jgi:hypothetical protein
MTLRRGATFICVSVVLVVSLILGSFLFTWNRTSNAPASFQINAVDQDDPVSYPVPANGSSDPLPAGKNIILGVSGLDQICLLVRVRTASEEDGNDVKKTIAPVGRSYNGRLWEAMAGHFVETIYFECSKENETCRVELPQAENTTKLEDQFVLISYEHSVTRKQDVARFLEQAAFGPTRAEIYSWDFGKFDGSFARWISDQIEVKRPTLHRQYFRERANARATWRRDTLISLADKPCDQFSRWRKYSFGFEEDRASKRIDVSTPNGSSVWLLLSIDGYPRTEVPQSDWGHLVSDGDHFIICRKPEEWVGGELRIFVNDSCIQIVSGNPLIQFHDTQPTHLMHLSPDVNFTVVDEEDSNGDDLILSADIQNPFCQSLSVGGGVTIHATISATGNTTVAWLLHDPRIVLRNNTIHEPLFNGGGDATIGRETLCSAAPRTFLNSKDCRMSESEAACGPMAAEPDVSVTLDEDAIQNFFVLAQRYVYALNMTEPIKSPCVLDERSRWWKIKLNDTICVSSSVDSASEATLRSLLSASKDTKNPHLRDILMSDEGSVCSAAGTKGVLIFADGDCWQHVHSDQYSVYDFSSYVDIHEVC